VDKINQTNIENWTVQELKKILTSDSENISFSNFAQKYIDDMLVSGRKKPAANYQISLHSLESYFGKKLYFSDITSKEIKKWIESLSNTARAKQMYSDSVNFNKAINTGLKSICEKEEVKKITTCYLRHSWATIAQNHCGASTEMVAFCLNHSSAHKVTESYIKKDFSPIDELNKKVLDYIFEK